ncbi:MAG: PRC-barrel domain-containing protein, partial [Nanoarchaeota archaeon]|nr:PRC-barrel domain-containing protein [Nanoarchaeota archaeon]
KNIIYSQETSRNVSYNVSVILYNTGDEDLIDAVYTDTDINSTSLVLDIYRGDSQEFSNLVVIDKAASNIEYEFELGTAVAGSLSFYSNRPKINIPGYGGPADLHVYAPDFAAASTSFDSIIEVLNMNLDIGQDFVIDYWITDNEESVNYSSGQKTIYVPALGDTNTSVSLASPSIAGNYKLKAIVSWAGGTAIAFDSFEVVSGQIIAPPTSGGGGGGGGIIIPKNKTETIEANISKGIEEPKAEPEETERREIICNSPYIRYGEECCLDEDNNLICDEDETKRGITGLFLRDNGEIYVNYSLIGLLLLLLLIIFIIYKLIRRLPKLFAKSGKKKDIMRLNDVKGMKVYSLDGIEIGKVADIFLKNNKIDSLKIKLVKKKSKKIKKKGILLDYKHVKNMGNIAIIDERIIDIFDNINL